MKKEYFEVFKKGSRTYYYSSAFFPKDIREEVSILYAFVRIIDDLVDSVPQQNEEFYRLWKLYNKKEDSGVEFMDDFKRLTEKTIIKPEWVEAFWKSMEMDLVKPVHKTLKEVEEYMYGSAEVIGLMMARILELPKEAEEGAQKLGKAMQYLNFIRDIDEDAKMKRNYLQVKTREKYVKNFPTFRERFFRWQREAEAGFQYLPKRYLIPIKTASEMYKWTINKIEEDPMIVFKKKVKPSKARILATGIFIGLTI